MDPKRPVYLAAGELWSCLGENLEQSVLALHERPPQASLYQTPITGDLSKSQDHVPYRFLKALSSGCQAERIERVLLQVVASTLAQSDLQDCEKKRLPVFLGSSSFMMGASEQLYQSELVKDSVAAVALRDVDYGRMGRLVADRFALGGGTYAFNTACTASASRRDYRKAPL